jgi:hypothetical protein
MSNETTCIVRYGETPSPIADALTRYGLGGELAGHNGGPPLEDESKIPGWITEAQFARQLGLSIATVRRWRRRRYGPPWVKIGRRDYTPENAAADFAAGLLAAAEATAQPPRRGRGRPRISRK